MEWQLHPTIQSCLHALFDPQDIQFRNTIENDVIELFLANTSLEQITILAFFLTTKEQFSDSDIARISTRALELLHNVAQLAPSDDDVAAASSEAARDEIFVMYSRVSCAISALLHLLTTIARKSDATHNASMISRVGHALERLWQIRELTRHMDDPWIGDGLVAFLFATLAGQSTDICAIEAEPLVRAMCDLMPKCIESTGTSTTGVKMLWLVLLYSSMPTYTSTSTTLDGVIASLKRLHKSVRVDIRDASIWIDASCFVREKTFQNQFRGISRYQFSDPLTSRLAVTLQADMDLDQKHMEILLLVTMKLEEIRKQFFTFDSLPIHRLFWTACLAGQEEIVRAILSTFPHHAKELVLTQDPQDYNSSALHKSARRERSLGTVKALFELGDANPSVTRRGGATPLHIAASRDCIRITRELVARGAVVDTRDDQNKSGLYWAAACGCNETARFFLEFPNVDINCADQDGFTVLHRTAICNNVPFMHELLKRGAKINATTRGGRTPLHRAIVKGCSEAAIALIKAGADPNLADSRGDTPLKMAVSADLVDVVRFLVEEVKVPVNVSNKRGISPLHCCVSPEVCKILLAAGANINATSQNTKETPLITIAADGCAPVVEMLLDAGANIESCTTRGFTALMAAASKGSVEVVSLLLKRGANVRAQSLDGATPIHVACLGQDSHAEVVRLLLEHGASANAMASNTVRPIHLAASAYKGAAMMKTLLQYGAEVDAEISEGGGNALTIALSARRREQALLLLEAGADPLYAPSIPNAPLVAAARAGFHDVLQLMIESAKKRGKSFDRIIVTTALKRAITHGNWECALLLAPLTDIVVVGSQANYEKLPWFIKQCPNIRIVTFHKRESRDFLSDESDSIPDEMDTNYTENLEAILDIIVNLVTLNLPNLHRISILELDYGKVAQILEKLHVEEIERALETNFHLLSLSYDIQYPAQLDDPTQLNTASISMELFSLHSRSILNLLHRNQQMFQYPTACLQYCLLKLLETADETGDCWVGDPNAEDNRVAVHSFIVKARLGDTNLQSLYNEAPLPPSLLRLFMVYLYSGEFPLISVYYPFVAQYCSIATLDLESAKSELEASPWLNRTLESDEVEKAMLVKQMQALLDENDGDFVIEVTSRDGDKATARTFRCHRHLLAVRWPWFNRLMSSGLKEATEGRLIFAADDNLGIDADFLYLLLQYIYTGEVQQFDDVNYAVSDSESLSTFFEHVLNYFGFTETPELRAIHQHLIQKLMQRVSKASTNDLSEEPIEHMDSNT